MAATSEAKKDKSDVFKELEIFGRFQTIQYVLVCLPLCILAMSIINYVFVAEIVDFRCRVPQCDDEDSTVEVPPWWPESPDIKCMRPVLDPKQYNSSSQCSRASFLPDWEECTEWIYENENSLVAGLDLGCQSWMATLVGSVHNSAMIASMMISGWVADKIGRKPAIIICSVCGVIGLVKIFITNLYLYLVVEFLESFLSSGLYTVGVVLLIEIGGEHKRVLAGVIFSYATYVGECLLAVLALLLQHWKYLILAAYLPAIFFLSYAYLLCESTRWQMLRGKMIEAKNTFKSIAKMNKIDITPEEIDTIDDEELRLKFNVQMQKEKESFMDIVRSKEMMIRLVVVSVCFFSAGFVYCGLMVHSVYLPGNKYTNFVLVSVTAFPGELLAYYTFNKYGRRITLQCGYFATAIFTLAQAFTPESMTYLKIVLFLFGKFAIVVCFTGTYTYCMELFPTSVRGSLVGCANTFARIGTLLSPLTPLLTVYMEALPSILFSTTAIIGGMLLMFTPETRKIPLSDTIAEVEAYKAKNKPSSV